MHVWTAETYDTHLLPSMEGLSKGVSSRLALGCDLPFLVARGWFKKGNTLEWIEGGIAGIAELHQSCTPSLDHLER